MGGVPDVRRPGDLLGESSDGRDSPTAGQIPKKGLGGEDLVPGRPAIRRCRSGMGRDDVPAESLDPELGKSPPDDRGGGLGRASAGELPLGGEGKARHSGTPVTGRFAYKQKASA